MAYVFTLTNAKGGVGKTTISRELSLCFAKGGYRTLAIDMDQQGNLSASLGINLNTLNKTATRLLIDDDSMIIDYIVEARPNLKLLPNSIDIDADDILEAKKFNRELLLRQKLNQIQNVFDVIIIDTPPALRTATINSLVVANSVVIPIDSGSFAMLGVGQLVKVISAVHTSHNPTLIMHVLSTMYSKRLNLDKTIRSQAEKFFGPDLMLESIIHRYVAVGEAAAKKQGVVDNTTSPAAFDFIKLFKELERSVTDEQARTRTSKTGRQHK